MAKKKKKKYEIHLSYDGYETGGDAIDPEDQWSSREDMHRQFHPQFLYVNRDDVPTWQSERIEIDFKPEEGTDVFLLVVRYESGDTFGRSYGNWHIFGVYQKRKEAKQLKVRIEREEQEYEDGGREWKDSDCHKPWRGYFERMEGVEIYNLDIE